MSSLRSLLASPKYTCECGRAAFCAVQCCRVWRNSLLFNRNGPGIPARLPFHFRRQQSGRMTSISAWQLPQRSNTH